MSNSIQVDIPLEKLVCSNCHQILEEERGEVDLDFHMTNVIVPGDKNTHSITVPIDVQKLVWRKKSEGEYTAEAIMKIDCPCCHDLQELRYQFQAPTIFLQHIAKCSHCGGELFLDNQEIDYTENDDGVWVINAKAVLVCQICSAKYLDDINIPVPSFQELQSMGSYEINSKSFYKYGHTEPSDKVFSMADEGKVQIVKTILITASTPQNEARLRLDKEVWEINEGLRRSAKRDQFKLEQRWAIRANDLQRALLDIEPQIVHFSGHGVGEDGLLVEDDSGKSRPISTEALAKLFELCADHVECVVLNACYSEIQAHAIAQHIQYVIGMSHAIGDVAAIKFATGFYDALGAGKSIETAYKFGCSAIQIENIPEYLTPKIIIRS